MTISKKALTVDLKKVITPLIEKHKSLIRIKDKPEYLLYLADSDPDSDFHFGITKETSESAGHFIHYAFQPHSSSNNSRYSSSSKLEQFIPLFNAWLSNITYHNESSILDDPILRGYQEEYFNDFKILDDDSDLVAFTYDQQLLLDNFFEDVKNGIPEYSNDQNDAIIEEILEDVDRLQATLTTQSKNDFMRCLSKVFAKARKAGLKTSNYVIKEFLKQTATKSADWIFNFAVHHSNQIPKYIEQFTKNILIS